MTTIGITGADGLIGRHLRAAFMAQEGFKVLGAGREAFADQKRLEKFAGSCDAIIHLAGKNRGEDAEIAETNVRLVQQLADACRKKTGKPPHVFFASSSHIALKTAYARSKRRGAEIFRQWASETGGAFTNLILPHVFGEGGRPFYNSAVATFCHQLANGEEPRIIEDKEIELVHAQDLAPIIQKELGAASKEVSVGGRKISVSGMLSILRELAASYRAQVIPDLRDEFRLRLFNAYRHCLFPRFYPVALELHSDRRGGVFEAVKELSGGQTFLSTSKPGVVRGNHFHLKKVERFLVVKGKAVIRVRGLFQPKAEAFAVDGESPCFIDMPTLHAHSIENVGTGDLVTLFWANEVFDPKNPDTIP
ncbi:MAG: NAD-dependent epimerase/dehydratase family protein [Elusimicrobia bacterium]|nr:NAD-dependent epimerase/dehydratase family protein [Elusimicrobiota bacterium]